MSNPIWHQFQKSVTPLQSMNISVLLLLLASFACSQPPPQCCLALVGRTCTSCPSGTHLFRGNCIIDTQNCVSYSDGFLCDKCKPGYFVNAASDCAPMTNGSDWVDVVLDLEAVDRNYALAYLLTVDYFRSFRSQVRNAAVVGAMARLYRNQTLQLAIEFQDADKFFRGVLQPNVSSNIFKEVSFAPVARPSFSLNAQIKEPEYELIDIKTKAHADRVALVTAEAKKNNTNIGVFSDGKILVASETSWQFTGTYKGSNQGDLFEVVAGFANGKVTISSIKQTATAPKNTTNSSTTSNSTTNSSTPITSNPTNNSNTANTTNNSQAAANATRNYVTFDINSTDENYQMVLDFVGSTSDKYKSLRPTKAARSINQALLAYRLSFTLTDGSTWQLIVTLNSDSLTLGQEKQTQLTPATRPVAPVFESTPVAQVLTEFEFILVMDYINKQSKDKYKDSVVRTVEKMVDTAARLNRYRVGFEEQGFLWEVLAQVNTTTFVASGFAETKKEAITRPGNNTTTNTTGGNSSSTPKNTTNTTNTNGNTSSPTIPNTTNNTSSTSNNRTNNSTPTTNSTSNTTAATNSTNTPNNTTKNNTANPSNTTTTPNNATTNNTTTATNNNTTKNGTSTNNTGTSAGNSTNNANSSSVGNNSNVVPNTTATNTTNNSSISPNPTGNRPIPPNVLALVGSLAPADQSTTEFTDIDALIRSVNPKELAGNPLLGAFQSTASFTRNYQIYYQGATGFEIWEARVSRDNLRKKTYILSFNRI